MNISIWQQFSSNHSAGFTLVGKFTSAEQAEQAATTLKEIIGQIAASNRARFETIEDFFNFQPILLSPVERAVREQYEAEDWTHALDYAYEDNTDRHVKRYENLVFVGSVIDSNSVAKPFDTILRKLGAKISGEEEQNRIFVSCLAPDETVARRLQQELVYRGNQEQIWVPIDTRLFHIGQIEREEQQLHIIISGCWLSELNSSTFNFLHKLVSYLKSAGCSDFTYSVGEG
ncbi:MAG: hypothetical protein KJ064_08070 [Anaerolineae bacterium]|nr:hypothetical protein [Anaerolineae bacterium]